MQTTPVSPVRWTTADLKLFAGDRTNRHEIVDGELINDKDIIILKH